MNVIIESTNFFTRDLTNLSEDDRALALQKVNDCVKFFPTQKADVYGKLRRLDLSSTLSNDESSLYTLKASQKIRLILAVDEDPVVGKVTFTLFRAVDSDDLGRAYQGVVESLHKDMLDRQLETVRACN
jgi:hypothetical protein